MSPTQYDYLLNGCCATSSGADEQFCIFARTTTNEEELPASASAHLLCPSSWAV